MNPMLFKTTKPDTQQSSQATAEEISQITTVCERAAHGDMEARVLAINPASPLRETALAINRLLDFTDAYIREAAAAMENCSQDRFHRPILLRAMHGSFHKSSQVINFAGKKMRESSRQMEHVEQLASATAEKVSSVAAACEELSATTTEISQKTKFSSHESQQTVTVVKTAESSVKQLREAALKINDVVSLISNIARQTNLLALNATIEAARAGEAGVSFAVVATEVKKLSNNIASATLDINRQVADMQKTMGNVVEIIQSINKSMADSLKSVEDIDMSVREQVTATNDIAQSLSAISANSNEVSDSIAELKKMKR